MQTMHWKSRRLLGFATIIVATYLLLRVKSYDYYAEVILDQIHPNEVWEFVADFSNMKILNPTILDFNILSESGNYDHWKYSTEYHEHLSHWPYLSNVAVAHYNVVGNAKTEIFLINSLHTTCLFAGFFCLDSSSEFKFSKVNSTSVLCKESVRYQCPVFLSAFCQREVAFQRNAIMRNLKQVFNGK